MKINLSNLQSVYGAKKCSIETMELKGFELIENLMVDNSGFGSENEPAYTQSQFERKLEAIVREHGTVTATITDCGQFQVYIGLFKKTGVNRMKKLANNTYKIDYDTTDAIRFHDTDILVFESDHVTLNTGGWHSVTTKQRLNQYLPNGVYVQQKNFEWYLHDTRDNTVKEFQDGMTIAS